MDQWPRHTADKTIEIPDVPFYPQDVNQCGPATLAEVLDFAGVQETPESLEADLYIPARQGSLQLEMLAQARRRGRVAYVIPPTPGDLLSELQAGHPVLVLQNLGLAWIPDWHYSVVVGYRPEEGVLILHSGGERDYELDSSIFENTWARADHWGMVVLTPGSVPASGNALQYAQAVDAMEASAGAPAAAVAWDAGIERWPDSLELGFGQGNNRYARGDLSGAERSFRKVLKSHPDAAVVYNNLAYVLAALGRMDEAQQAASLAVHYGGADIATYQDTLREMRCRTAGRPADCTP